MPNDVQLSPAKLPHDFLGRFPDSLLGSQLIIPPEVDIHLLRIVEWACSLFLIFRASILTDRDAQMLRLAIADLPFEFRPHLTTAECLLRFSTDVHGDRLGVRFCAATLAEVPLIPRSTHAHSPGLVLFGGPALRWVCYKPARCVPCSCRPTIQRS